MYKYGYTYSRSDGDRAVVHSDAFDCFQNPLKTKGVRSGSSFEAENEILSFHFQKVDVELLRNLKKKKGKY